MCQSGGTNLTVERVVTEADDRYLEEIGEDCERVLGPGIELIGLVRDQDDDAVRLTARFRLGDRVWESVARGETPVAAHAELRARLLFDRLRFGFSVLVDRP
jgi:hypothetical protein